MVATDAGSGAGGMQTWRPRARRFRPLVFPIALWLFTFLRYTETLSDDDQWALWKSTMVLLGDVPVRDFVLVGDPLDMGMSLLFQVVFGATALSEYLLGATVLTIGTMLFAAATRRLGVRGRLLGVVYVGLFLAAARIDIHTTPKHIALGLAAFTISVVVGAGAEGRSRWPFALTILTCGVAFFYRHDLLAVVLPALTIALLLSVRPWQLAARRVMQLASAIGAMVVFYLALVATVTGSFHGVADYVGDYLAIARAKSADRSPMVPAAPLQAMREAIAQLSDRAARFADGAQPLGGATARASVASGNPADVLSRLDRLREVCRPDDGCAVSGIKIMVPATVNVARDHRDVLISPFTRDIKGLRRPTVATMVGETIIVEWEELLTHPDVQAAERAWGLTRESLGEPDAAKYVIRPESPIAADFTALLTSPLVYRVERLTPALDVAWLTENWNRVAGDTAKEIEIADTIPRDALESIFRSLDVPGAVFRFEAQGPQLRLSHLAVRSPDSPDAAPDEEPLEVTIHAVPIPMPDRRRAAIVPYFLQHVWILLLPLAVAATAAFAVRDRQTAAAIAALVALQMAANPTIVRREVLVPLYLSLPLVVTAVMVVTGKNLPSRVPAWRRRAVRTLSTLWLLSWFVIAVPTLAGEVEIPRGVEQPSILWSYFNVRRHEATLRPRSQLTAADGGLHFIEAYISRCTAPSDRIMVGGDRMSIPYVTQRRVFYTTDFHEGVPASEQSQSKVAEQLHTSRHIPIYLSENFEGPWSRLSQRTIRRAARDVFDRLELVADSPMAAGQSFWIGFSRNYRFNAVDEVSGWPCYRSP